MIEFRNISYAYEDRTIFENFNFSIKQGELLAILGPSGCGKSTFLNLLAGFLNPVRGQISVAGEQIKGPGPDRPVVFQKHALFPWMSNKENLLFGPKSQGIRQGQWDQLTEEYFETFGLQGTAELYPYQLSGGMQQRLGLARAMITRPKILLMDEPLGALDALTRAELQAFILKVLSSNNERTGILVTHSIDEALLLGSRVVLFAPQLGEILLDEQLNFHKDANQAESLRIFKKNKQFQAKRSEVAELLEQSGDSNG